MEGSNEGPLYFDAHNGMDSNEESVYESCSDGSDDDDDQEEETEEEEGDDDVETHVVEAENNDLDISLDSDNDNANSSQCPVCLMSLSGQQLGTPNNCDHVFCFLCISEWSKNSNTCPVDRKKFEEILVHTTKKGPTIKRVKVEDKQVLTDADWEQAPTYCEICNQCNREAMMLLCDGCDRGYHMFCLTPRLYQVPAGDWYCDLCFVIRNETNIDDGFPVPDLVPSTSGVSTSPVPSRERTSSTRGRGSSRTGTGSRTPTTRRSKSHMSSTRGRRKSKRGRGTKRTSSRNSTSASRRKRKMKSGKNGKRKSSRTSVKKSPKKKRKFQENVLYQASLITGRTPRERLDNSLRCSSVNERVRPLGSRTSLSIFGDEFALHDFEAVAEDQPEEKPITPKSRPRNDSSDVLTSIMDDLEVLHDDEARISRDGSVLPSEQQSQNTSSKSPSHSLVTMKSIVRSSESGDSLVKTGLPVSVSCPTTSSKTQVNKILPVKHSPPPSPTETPLNISPLKRHFSPSADNTTSRKKKKMVSFASMSDDSDEKTVNDCHDLSEQSCGHSRDHPCDIRDNLISSSDLSREHSTIDCSSDSSWRGFPHDYVRYNWKQSRERDFSLKTAHDGERYDLQDLCTAKDSLPDLSHDLLRKSSHSADSKYLPRDDKNNFLAFVSSGQPSHMQSSHVSRKESSSAASIKEQSDATPFSSNNESSYQSIDDNQTVDNPAGTANSCGIDKTIKLARHRISLVTSSSSSTITQTQETKPSRPSLPCRARKAMVTSSVTMETAMPQNARVGRSSIPVSKSVIPSKYGAAEARTLSSRFDSSRLEVSLTTAISKNSGASGRPSLSSRFSTSSILPVVSMATVTSSIPRRIEFERNSKQLTVNVVPDRPKQPSLPCLPAKLPYPALPRLKSFKPSESQLSLRPKLKGLSSSSHGYPEPDNSYKQNLAIIDMLRAKKSTLKAEIRKETASLVTTSSATQPSVTFSCVTHSPQPHIEGYSLLSSSSQQLQNKHAHIDMDLHRPKLSSLLGQSSRKSSLPVAIVRPRTATCERETSATTEIKRESSAVVTVSGLPSLSYVKSEAQNSVFCDDDERQHNRKKGIARLQRLTSIKDTVRLVLQQFYDHHEISRTEFKDIFVRAVQKVNESNQDVNYLRIADLVKKYVKKYKGLRIQNSQVPCEVVTQ